MISSITLKGRQVATLYLIRCNPAGLARYNTILLYDRDGASVGNLRSRKRGIIKKISIMALVSTFYQFNIKTRSPLWRAYTRLKNSGLEPKVTPALIVMVT